MKTIATKFVRAAEPGQVFMGEPDGPMRYVPSLGMEVPTYVDPREDLKTTAHCRNSHKAVDYHIPRAMRGTYLPTELADYNAELLYSTGKNDLVRCGGIRNAGYACQKLAMNRTGFCTNHGGALHPADKVFTMHRNILPDDISTLSRLQKVTVGIIPVSELDDEEIAKGMIRNDDGTFTRSPIADKKIFDQMKREFFARAERMMQEQAYDMIKVMREMAMSELNEPRDRIQAAQWNIERILGKTPDVLITHTSEKPFESIMAAVTGGSRDDYRNGELPSLTDKPGNVIEGEVAVDDEQYDEDADDETVEENLDIHMVDVTDTAVVVETESEDKDGDNTYAAMVAVVDKKKEIEEAKARIKKARNRRFAARAQGATSLENLGFSVVFKDEKALAGTGTCRMKLIAPDDQIAPQSR